MMETYNLLVTKQSFIRSDDRTRTNEIDVECIRQLAVSLLDESKYGQETLVTGLVGIRSDRSDLIKHPLTETIQSDRL